MSDIDTAVVDGLKALDPKWPIREADIVRTVVNVPLQPRHASFIGGGGRSSTSSLAMLAAMRRASSRVKFADSLLTFDQDQCSAMGFDLARIGEKP